MNPMKVGPITIHITPQTRSIVHITNQTYSTGYNETTTLNKIIIKIKEKKMLQHQHIIKRILW